jgi:hypothetical protein
MGDVKSRSTQNLRIAVFSSAIVTTSAFACGGIDESPLFSGDTTTSGNDGGTKTDSGSTANKDSGTTTVDDSGTTPPAGGLVQCSSGDCNISENQICCYSSDTHIGTCDTSADCSGDGQFPIPCDSTSDCAALGFTGTVCCAQADNTGAVTSVQCKAPANCRSDQGQTNLCDPGGNDCTAAQTCTPSKVSLPGYDICVAN